MITRCLVRLAPTRLLRGIVVPRAARAMNASLLRAAAPPAKVGAAAAAALALCSSSSLAADGTTVTAPGPLGALTGALLTGEDEAEDTVLRVQRRKGPRRCEEPRPRR